MSKFKNNIFEFWVQEAHDGVIEPVPEVGDVDLQPRFDDLSMAYADLSNEKKSFWNS